MPSTDEDIDTCLELLIKQLKVLCAQYGFIRYLIDNRHVQEKYLNSRTGHVVNLQINSVIDSSVLLICRVWDGNLHSLPWLARQLSGRTETIKAKRRHRRPDWSDDWLGLPHLQNRVRRFADFTDAYQNSPEFRAIKVYRDEYLGHILPEISGARRALIKEHGAYNPTTYNQILRASERTFRNIQRAEKIWNFSLYVYGDLIGYYSEYSKTYWDALPKLSDFESR